MANQSICHWVSRGRGGRGFWGWWLWSNTLAPPPPLSSPTLQKPPREASYQDVCLLVHHHHHLFPSNGEVSQIRRVHLPPLVSPVWRQKSYFFVHSVVNPRPRDEFDCRSLRLPPPPCVHLQPQCYCRCLLCISGDAVSVSGYNLPSPAW